MNYFGNEPQQDKNPNYGSSPFTDSLLSAQNQ